ncbi:MAG: FtsH protease activity modulator HflK [Elusimicrobia bacterium]|nr:FtsH protease activity modulator HflK [Elusimicrobiota bacterium]
MPEPWEVPREEARDLMRALSEKFGDGSRFKGLFLWAIAAAVGALFLFSSVYTVEPSEEAVILRFGRFVSTEPPGLHFKLPFMDRAIKVKTKIILQEEFGFRSANRVEREGADYTNKALREESLTLTGDLNVGDVEWIVQYQISDPKKFLFNTREVLKNLRDVSQSVMRRVVGDRTVNEVLTTGRVEIADEAHRLTQEVLDRYDIGLRIVTVKLQNVNPPEPVKPAFNEVNAAKQEQEQVINQAEREYNKVIPEARGKAEQAIRDAEGYATAAVNRAEGDAARFRSMLAAYRTAPAVTRTRLYLETMEELYGRFKALTIVDKGVQGLLPVFPQKGQQPASGKTP